MKKSLVLFLISALMFSSCSRNDSSQNDKNLVPTASPQATISNPSTQPSPTDIIKTLVQTSKASSWQTYGSKKYHFSFKFPKDWEVVVGEPSYSENAGSVNIGPKSARKGEGYDGLFAFGIYSGKKISEVIDDMGSQFSDRKVVQEKVIINKLPVTKVTVTTKKYEGWIYINYLFVTDDYIYSFGNGASVNNYANLFNEIASTIKVQ